MEVLFLVGRLFFALLFIGSGIGHLRQTAAMAGYASSKGVPAAKAATIISGLMILLGAAYIALGFYADLGSLLIFLFLVPTAFLMHPYWKETDAMAKMNEMIAFNKDIALAGAALAFFYIFAKHGETVGLVLSTTTLF
jgi:uncharacterized membrane protein YphA (DoxX/SURF4 family)